MARARTQPIDDRAALRADRKVLVELAHFEHLEDIPEHPTDWKLSTISPGRAASLSQSLITHWEEALLYRQLATLRNDVPLTERLDDLKWRGAFPRLKELCAELGDEKIPTRISKWR